MNNASMGRLVLLATVTVLTGCVSCSRSGSATGTAVHEHSETRYDLGTMAAGGLELTATQIGEVEPGETASIDLKISGGRDDVKAVWVWMGSDDGSSAGRSQADYMPKKRAYHAHAMVPNPMPQNVNWQLEVVLDSGESLMASVPRAEPAPGE